MRGGRAEADAAPGGSTMDGIVATICGCDDFDDDGVQLQVIKALLTAVTSNTCAIHEGSLLVAVRSCYNIHLVTRNAVNKTTAKATAKAGAALAITRLLSKSNGAATVVATTPVMSETTTCVLKSSIQPRRRVHARELCAGAGTWLELDEWARMVRVGERKTGVEALPAQPQDARCRAL